jgi:hypothetical protein
MHIDVRGRALSKASRIGLAKVRRQRCEPECAYCAMLCSLERLAASPL